MRKVRMVPVRRAARGALATRKVPMAAPLCEARMVALLLSVRMAAPRIVRPLMAVLFMAVRFMPAPSTGHGWQHPITVPLSRAWHLAP
jgi:hypothetical protein